MLIHFQAFVSSALNREDENIFRKMKTTTGRQNSLTLGIPTPILEVLLPWRSCSIEESGTRVLVLTLPLPSQEICSKSYNFLSLSFPLLKTQRSYGNENTRHRLGENIDEHKSDTGLVPNIYKELFNIHQ